jgi:hypothetical protein
MIVSGNFQGAGVDPGPLFLVPGEPEGPGGADTKILYYTKLPLNK